MIRYNYIRLYCQLLGRTISVGVKSTYRNLNCIKKNFPPEEMFSSLYNAVSSFFTYYGSYGRSSPTDDLRKLKTLVQEKAILVITQQEIETTLKNLRKVDRIPKAIEDNRPEFIKELERRFAEKQLLAVPEHVEVL